MVKFAKINNESPLFLQFKEHIIGELGGLNLNPGDKIPSETVFCRSNSVSIRTVRRALGELEKDGVIVRRQGLGSFLIDLKASKSEKAMGTIGILFSDMDFVFRPMFSMLLSKMEELIVSQGYSFHLYAVGNRINDPNMKSLKTILPKDDIAGLIATSALNLSDITLLRRRKIPLVVFNDYKKFKFNTARVDYYNAARLGIQKLLSKGLKNIIFACGYFNNDKNSLVILNHDYFLQGIKDELEANLITFDKKNIIETKLTRNSGNDVGQTILNSTKKVDAIFTTSQLLAEGILDAIKENDDLEKIPPTILTFCTENFSSDALKMFLPIDEMANVAIKLLIKTINGDDSIKNKNILKIKMNNNKEIK